MKQLNRILSFILCIALLANVLCACKSSADTETVPTAAMDEASSDGSGDVSASAAEMSGLTADAVITFSGRTAAVSGSGADVEASDSVVTITDGGIYIVTGTASEGRVIVNAPKEDVTVILSNADITCSYGSPVYIYKSSVTTIRLEDGTTNTLTDGNNYTFNDSLSYVADDEPNACLYSKSDLVIDGNGKLIVNANYNNGITSKDTLKIESASIAVEAEDHGINGKDSCTLENADIQVTCGGDALRSTGGDLTICGGTYTISAGDDGIHAEGTASITDGAITITTSYEGIEGAGVDISGGTIKITASDDGINAAGGEEASNTQNGFAASSDYYINISGGFIEVDAEGDGIDSNGDITISGGELYISGPTNDGDSAIDYERTAIITGGIVIAAGPRGMAQNFGSNSTQGSILLTYPASTSEAITLKDASGNTLAEYAPDKGYNCVVISSPSITVGDTYTVTACGQTTTVTMDSLIYGSSGMENPGGMGIPDGMGRPDDMGGPDDMGRPDDTGRPDDMGTPPDNMGNSPDGMSTPPDNMGNPPDNIGTPPDNMGNPNNL